MKRLVFLRQLTLAALLSLVVFSCTKELTPIGLGLLDPVDLLSMGYTDTVQIKAYSIAEDSVFTHNLQYAQIGSMYDPIFGVTTSTFFSQVFLSTDGTRFDTAPVFDSAYLYLPYKTAYGDTLTNMTFHVYALTESILDSVHTYSNNTVSYDKENPLGEITFQPRPTDSAFYNGEKQAPMLRIPINEKFGNAIIHADTNYLDDNAAFVKLFKGICIVADKQTTSGKGSIVSFSLTSGYSRILMYYHNSEDTLTYSFPISNDCSSFHNYDHNGYAEAIPALKHQLDKTDLSLGGQFLFAQGLAGVKIKIEFPYMNTWFETEKIVINDAQLILGNASVSDVFTNPSSVTLRGVGEAGTTSPYTTIDESEGSAYFDGTYDDGSNSYRFRLSRYLQQLLLGKVNSNGLHLIIPSASYASSRLVLNGTTSEQSDLKLYLRYTRIR